MKGTEVRCSEDSQTYEDGARSLGLWDSVGPSQEALRVERGLLVMVVASALRSGAVGTYLEDARQGLGELRAGPAPFFSPRLQGFLLTVGLLVLERCRLRGRISWF